MSTYQNAAQTYRNQQVYSASPLDLVIMAYDAALIGCNNQDLMRTTRALNELKNALDFSYDVDIAMGLHRLYTYCGDQARANNYEHVAELLRELRDAWVQVREKYQPSATPVQTAPTMQTPTQPRGYHPAQTVRAGNAASLLGALA